MVAYHLDPEDEVSPASSTAFFGMYTSNKSYLAAARQELYRGQDRYRASITRAGGRINSESHATGATSDAGVWFPLETALAVFMQRFLGRTWDRLFVGAQYQLMWSGGTSPARDEQAGLPEELFPVETTVIGSGIGGVLEYDTRDNRFSATSGLYLTADAMSFVNYAGTILVVPVTTCSCRPKPSCVGTSGGGDHAHGRHGGFFYFDINEAF